MTPDEFAAAMRKIAGHSGGGVDTEYAHVEADELLVRVLRELGYEDGCDVFDNMNKWYA